jgi:hypothetical protein
MHARILMRPASPAGSKMLNQLERQRNLTPDNTRVYRVQVNKPGDIDVFVSDLDKLDPNWRDDLDYAFRLAESP